MAQLVEQEKIESARIRVENIIRSDITTELNEILELYCELLLARSQLLDPPSTSPLTNAKGHKEEIHIDPGLEEAVRSIIYAASQTGVKELHQARALLVEKFGKEFALSAMEGKGVAERVLKKLKVETPSRELVDAYLREICRTYGVRFPGDATGEEEEEEEEDEDDDDQPGSGGKIAELEDPLEAEELSKAKAPTDFGMSSPLRIAPPSPSTENVTPKLKLPEAAKRETKPKPRKASTDKGSRADGGGPGGKIPNLDDLTARFAALKR
jgi:vacuolar protein sorting-associated protein IST1